MFGDSQSPTGQKRFMERLKAKNTFLIHSFLLLLSFFGSRGRKENEKLEIDPETNSKWQLVVNQTPLVFLLTQ